MPSSVERAETVVEQLELASAALDRARQALLSVDLVFRSKAEASGLHNVSDELGALNLVRGAVARELSAWHGYHYHRQAHTK
jgi:hypothetical protein